MWGADDPDDRMPRFWPDQMLDAQVADPLMRPREPDTMAFDSTLSGYYQGVIRGRKTYQSLRRSRMELLQNIGAHGVFAFRRIYEGDTLTIVLYRGSNASALRLRGIGPDRLIFATRDDGMSAPSSDSMRVASLSGLVFR